MKNFAQTVQQIEEVPEVRDKVAGFADFKQTWARFVRQLPAFPQDGRGITLIAGTNGKGSVAKTLETLLSARGLRVGLFTSPHLLEITERIRSQGADLSREEFVRVFEHVDRFLQAHPPVRLLSRFEMLTLMMAETFFGGRLRVPVERAVLEVGVGGRLDPTRALAHQTSVITRLGLDHQELLGPDLSSIAREKCGIIDPGNLVVHAPFPAEARVAVGAGWIEAPPFSFRVETGAADPVWILQTEWGEARLGLLGQRAVENVSLALRVLQAQEGGNLKSLLPHLLDLKWPGRMERRSIDGKRVYFSGDHNLQGVESLFEILGHFRYRCLRVVVGIGHRKAHEEMLRIFSRLPQAQIYLTETPFKGVRLEDYANEWRDLARFAHPDPRVAFRHAVADAGDEDVVLVTGSLYLTGEILHSLADFAPSR